MDSAGIYKCIEGHLKDRITGKSAVGGGCISNAEKLIMQSGRLYFLKSGSTNGMFQKEANGLRELAKAGAIRVPEVILADHDFILMEFITSGMRKAGFFESFGRQFARLHRNSSEKFGFYEDNFIGATPQMNIPNDSEAVNWAAFYFNKRLLYQYQLAEKNGYTTEKLKKGFLLLEAKIEFILRGSEEKSSLLHGDLWGGNYLSDEIGNSVLIDPAVYYGHREADLAMTRLFGGFSSEFYEAYHEEFPLTEGSGFREDIYMLYHVMNHLNLFGRGYYFQAERLLWKYL